MKKSILLRSWAIVLAMALGTTTISAQKFLDKVKKAAGEVIKVETKTTSTTSTDQEEGPSAKEFLENVPSYQVTPIVTKDDNGNIIMNEDGTPRISYYLVDKDGNVCDVNTAKKHLKAAWKSGGIILAKVGVGAATGALASKGTGGNALIGAGVGAAVGLLTSADDIKKVKEQMKLMKECNAVLEVYQQTFTEEGLPKDASADLTNVEGIDFTKTEQITKSAAEIRDELAKSRDEGASLPDLNDVTI